MHIATVLIGCHKMLATILIGFIITIVFFGCYVSSNYRTRNYRVSLWHYLMASNDSVGGPPDTITGEVDTCVAPPSDVDMTGTKSSTGSTIVTKDGEQECNEPAKPNPPSEVSPDTAVPQKLEIQTEILGEVAKTDSMELEEINSTDASKADEAIKDENSTVNSKPIDSPPHGTEPSTSVPLSPSVSVPVPVPLSDEKDISPGRDQDEGEGENKSKGIEKKSSTPKGASKGNITESANFSPTRELRSTKKKLQKEWEEFVNSLSKELQKLMGGYWATEDTERYLDGYPNAKDRPGLDKNIKFYSNQIPSAPDGNLIDIIHEHWMKQYDMLEQHHGYIQWLFPIQEQGLNSHAHPLQKHEIVTLKSCNVKLRLIRSYELMLDFFGMKLTNRETGTIARSDEYQKQQYRLLNSSFHNYLRITRILKCLGEFDLQHFQAPFCKFVLSEIFENDELKNTLKSCLSYWGKVIKDFEERKEFYKLADDYVQTDVARKGGVVSRELNRYFY